MQENQRSFEEILQSVNKDYLQELYLDQLLSVDKIAVQLGVCRSTALKLISYYDLRRDPHAVKSLSNKIVKNKLYEDTKKMIPKELLVDFYLTQDNGYYDTIKHFNISEWIFDRLLQDYQVKKDRTKSYEKGLSKRIERYGANNTTNWQKGQQTRIDNSGDLETSYKEGYQKQVRTMLDKYGVSCPFSLDEINRKKKHTGPNEAFARLLNSNGISYEREFVIDKKSYDFKIGNCLVEINPIVTHNTNFNPFNKEHDYQGLDKDYHHEKRELQKRQDIDVFTSGPGTI